MTRKNKMISAPMAYDDLLRNNFGAFVEKCFQTLHPGGKFKRNWHLDAMTHRLDQAQKGVIKRLIINVPPRSLKSICTSVALPAFIMGHDPAARIICVSYAQPLASKLSRDTRRILESDWYQRLFPGTRIEKSTEELIETTASGSRLATSLGAVVTGFGGQYIIIDDPMKPDEAASQAAREKAIRYFRETLFSRLDSKENGVIILVMQRLHEDDLTGYLLREGGGIWTHLNFPAIAPDDEVIELGGGMTHTRLKGDVLHPDHEPLSALDEIRQNLGSAAFEAQYQQSPIPMTGNMVKKEWIQHYHGTLTLEGGRVVQSWDTAVKGDPTCDYSVCTTWLVREHKHYLLDVSRKQMDFPELLKEAQKLHKQYQPHAVLIEDQGSGSSMIQVLKNQCIPAIGRRSKDDKVTRLSTVLPMFEAGQVFLPADEPWLPALLHELYGFDKTKYDDQVDSISQYLIWARERDQIGSFSADFGHEEPVPTMEWVAEAILAAPRWPR